MKFTKHSKTWYVSEDGFEFHFEPIEDTLTMKQSKDKGYEAKYLIQDDDNCVMDDLREGDDAVFHVNYHRDYWITSKIVSEDDIKEWYQTGKCSQQKEYHIFPLKSLIHSGVWLSLGTGGFECDAGGWDTSHVGAVLVSKKEWKTKAKAEKAAESFIEEVNKINAGDVYCCVREMFTKEKEPIDYDICGGFIGFEFAKESLKEF